ncbi:hypothetical protein WEH80_08625 [Actinomycetes bacterium KLBMP 9759]
MMSTIRCPIPISLGGFVVGPDQLRVLVRTHHARDAVGTDGATARPFVAEGIASAMEQAKDAAGGGDVVPSGGALVERQYLAAGLLDEVPGAAS